MKMEASVDPQCRGPDWMPITPKTGSLFHAETQECGQNAHVWSFPPFGRFPFLESDVELAVFAVMNASGSNDAGSSEVRLTALTRGSLAGMINPAPPSLAAARPAKTALEQPSASPETRHEMDLMTTVGRGAETRAPGLAD
jgi:hypothetical protein